MPIMPSPYGDIYIHAGPSTADKPRSKRIPELTQDPVQTQFTVSDIPLAHIDAVYQTLDQLRQQYGITLQYQDTNRNKEMHTVPDYRTNFMNFY